VSDERDSLVVVGSSAGGIEALSVLVGTLKKEFPAPIVLAQHLDPHRPSLLGEILGRKTQLPVVQVENQSTLEKGKVYVIPSNRHVVIRDGQVALESDHGDRPRPSIDLLLSSAARTYGDRLIAVILTGAGSDGADGAVEVKNAGGVVVIQNPETAAHPSMPLALPPTAVDYVTELPAIGPLVTDLLTHDRLPDRLDGPHQDALAEVLARVARHASIDFSQYKSTSIIRRLSRRMAVSHSRTLQEYRDHLDAHPAEVAELAKSLLIKVTEFFRDREAFAFLESEILPALIRTARTRGRILRLWSAGCATGEEAYSLALVVTHLLGDELPEWKVKIFATDVDHDAIAFARRGLYPRTVVNGIRDTYAEQYLEPADQGVRVHKSIRQMVIFGQQDLSHAVPFPRIDLVVCRNLLIYFKPELQQQVLDLFAYSLHQSRGYLFLGKAETARPSKSVFDLVNKKWKVYRCQSGPMPISVKPPAAAGTAAALLQSVREEKPEAGLPDAGDGRSNESELLEIRRNQDLLQRQLTIGVVMIDRSYRIVTINPMARRLLGIRDQGLDRDFLHSSRGLPYQEMRNAIDRVFRDHGTEVLGELPLAAGALGSGTFVSVTVLPIQSEGGIVDFAFLMIHDVSEAVTTRRRLNEVEQQNRSTSDELNAANRRLTDMNKELQDANEELQAANEEMMVAQEELQATNEEFEATNEELQATNEELETNNEEIQATNEELETTNEELQARTAELQETTRALSSERRRLVEVVELAPFHSMLLRAPSLEVETVNESLGVLFGAMGVHDVVGKPFDQVCTDPRLDLLRSGLHQVITARQPWSSHPIELGEPGKARWFVFTAVAIRNDHDQMDNVVVYAEDVTNRRLLEEIGRTDRLKTMLDQVVQVAMALFDAPTGRLLHGTDRYLSMVERFLGFTRTEAMNRTWDELRFGSSPDWQSFERVMSRGEPARLPELVIEEGERTTVWDCSLVPIRGTDGTRAVQQIVFAAIEVTQAVRRRQDLERLDRMKDEFLSLASHELRTPLAPLSAYTDVLAHLIEQKERDAHWDEQVRHVVERFRKQVRYMSRLSDDLLDVSRLQSGKFRLQRKPVTVRSIVDDAIEQSGGDRAKPPIRLSFESDSNGELMVDVDELRASQVVRNFLVNARRYAPATTSIDVRVRPISVEGHRWVRIEVHDDGPGIPREAQDRLFTRYFQIESPRSGGKGLGLGLFIARQIVEQHGGRIGADFDRGSTFWMELPLLES